MDHIEILFKEYDTLRTEIIALTGYMYQVIGYGAAVSGALIAWGAGKGFESKFWFLVIVFWGLVVLLWLLLHVAIARITEHLREVEADVNRRAGAELLKWESRKSPSRLWLTTLFIRRK